MTSNYQLHPNSFYSLHELDALRTNQYIRERVSETYPYISSFNFTKQAFWEKHWDNITSKTRGLFIDTRSNAIAMRSYDKFFNWGERHETSEEYLKNNLKFPVVAWQKENGFLGILGVDVEAYQNDPHAQNLLFASKSSLDGDFAKMFKEIFMETVCQDVQQTLQSVLYRKNATAIFEVIDPVRDPHIIEYPKPMVVLLDTVANLKNFQIEHMPLLKNVNLLKKIPYAIFENWQQLKEFYDQLSTDQSIQIEGVVLVDANQYHVKIKSAFYNHWKTLRGGVDRMVNAIKQNKVFKIDDSRYNEEQQNFLMWAMCQSTYQLENTDIITLRKAYLNL